MGVSGGLNNDSNSQSYSLNVTQLLYDFEVTGKEVDAVEKESLASQSKVESEDRFTFRNYYSRS